MFICIIFYMSSIFSILVPGTHFKTKLPSCSVSSKNSCTLCDFSVLLLTCFEKGSFRSNAALTCRIYQFLVWILLNRHFVDDNFGAVKSRLFPQVTFSQGNSALKAMRYFTSFSRKTKLVIVESHWSVEFRIRTWLDDFDYERCVAISLLRKQSKIGGNV